jgi:putative transposase
MSQKLYKPEHIIGMLREAEIRLSQGQTVGEVCRGFGVSEQSYYRWRREYGGMEVSQAHRLKELEKENARLRKAFEGQCLRPQEPEAPGGMGATFGDSSCRRLPY